MRLEGTLGLWGMDQACSGLRPGGRELMMMVTGREGERRKW